MLRYLARHIFLNVTFEKNTDLIGTGMSVMMTFLSPKITPINSIKKPIKNTVQYCVLEKVGTPQYG